MDEIGTIHRGNMFPLMKYANDRGIYLITAVPEMSYGHYFDKVYDVVIKKKGKYSDVQLAFMYDLSDEPYHD